VGIIRGRGDDELNEFGERVPTVLAIGHDEPDAFYRRPASFKAVSKRWVQMPGEGWQFVASCCHRGDTATTVLGSRVSVEPANASRPSGAACAQAFAKTAAVVRRGATPQQQQQQTHLSRSSTSTSASASAGGASAPEAEGGGGLAISSIVVCSSVAIAFILVRRRLMRDGAGSHRPASRKVGAGALDTGAGASGDGGLAWPGSRERLPLRM
jgi:hypothetical protein